ncbi:MAG: hypothetical protein PHF64_00345 [Methanoregula sp.]|nr:hypothetical protein [Methanoregula sp.]
MRAKKTIACAILLLLSSLALADWTDVPGNLQCTLFLYDYTGSVDASVAIGPWTWEMVGPLFSRILSPTDAAEVFRLIILAAAPKFGPDARFLYMRVRAWSGHEGRAYWFPWNLVFVQNGRQYTVTTNNMLSGFKGLFSGRVYTELDGFVRVPDGIDYSRPFDIWYDEEKATLGPIT